MMVVGKRNSKNTTDGISIIAVSRVRLFGCQHDAHSAREGGRDGCVGWLSGETLVDGTD